MQVDTLGARLLLRLRRAARHAHGPRAGADARARSSTPATSAGWRGCSASTARSATPAPDRARDRARARARRARHDPRARRDDQGRGPGPARVRERPSRPAGRSRRCGSRSTTSSAQLDAALPARVGRAPAGRRLAAISFHSLEDRARQALPCGARAWLRLPAGAARLRVRPRARGRASCAPRAWPRPRARSPPTPAPRSAHLRAARKLEEDRGMTPAAMTAAGRGRRAAAGARPPGAPGHRRAARAPAGAAAARVASSGSRRRAPAHRIARRLRRAAPQADLAARGAAGDPGPSGAHPARPDRPRAGLDTAARRAAGRDRRDAGRGPEARHRHGPVDRAQPSVSTKNQALQADVAGLMDDQRIERLAAKMGMVMPDPAAVSFLSAQPGAGRAVANIRSGPLDLHRRVREPAATASSLAGTRARRAAPRRQPGGRSTRHRARAPARALTRGPGPLATATAASPTATGASSASTAGAGQPVDSGATSTPVGRGSRAGPAARRRSRHPLSVERLKRGLAAGAGDRPPHRSPVSAVRRPPRDRRHPRDVPGVLPSRVAAPGRRHAAGPDCHDPGAARGDHRSQRRRARGQRGRRRRGRPTRT